MIGVVIFLSTINSNETGDGSRQPIPAVSDASEDKAFSQWQRDKAALEKAIEIDTLEAYQQFIDENPDSVWKNNFIYYRDRAAFRLAQERDTADAYQEFIDEHQGSDWIQQAIYYQHKAAGKNGPPEGRIGTDERIDVHYKTSIIKAFDASSIFLKNGADVKIIRVYNRAQANTSGDARIGHLTLFDHATTIIDGGKSIGYLTLNDESVAEIVSVDTLSWLQVSRESKAYVHGCNPSFNGNVLSGVWEKTGTPFSFQVVELPLTHGTQQEDRLPANVVVTGCKEKVTD